MSTETRNFYEEIQIKAQASEDIARQTLEFFANNGHIKEIPMGQGAMTNGTPKKLYESYSVAGKKGAAIGNKLRAAQLREQK